MLTVYNFKNGNTIEAYPKSPDFGRIIVAQITQDFKMKPNGDAWFKETTRVAFIKGRIADLEKNFGHLKSGQLFSDSLCIVKNESFEPFWTYQKTDETDGTKKTISQPCKIKPGSKSKGTVDTPVHIDGKPVYMQFAVAPVGTKDSILENSPVVPEADDADALITNETEQETVPDQPA